jgi:hypothetical protein
MSQLAGVVVVLHLSFSDSCVSTGLTCAGQECIIVPSEVILNASAEQQLFTLISRKAPSLFTSSIAKTWLKPDSRV